MITVDKLLKGHKCIIGHIVFYIFIDKMRREILLTPSPTELANMTIKPRMYRTPQDHFPSKNNNRQLL